MIKNGIFMSEKQLKKVNICLLNHFSWSKLSLKQTGVVKKCPKFYDKRPKGPETVFRVVYSLKNQYKWPKLDL